MDKRPLYTNNDRRRAGVPTRRKASRGRRYKTRSEALDTITAFLDYANGDTNTDYHRSAYHV